MKKLDDIPKKNPFDVPDDYFDQLPAKIHLRAQGKSREQSGVWIPGMRYAMAMVVVVAVVFVLFWRTPDAQDAESPAAILATLETADLVAYLNDGDITTDELLENIHFNNEDATEIEEAAFNLNLDDAELNDLVHEID
ncbi:MAG TPA: hypothetical protein VK658_16105 [Chryseolinea sp.]|nr:hypothetical protein [Chryseolinea sp.]